MCLTHLRPDPPPWRSWWLPPDWRGRPCTGLPWRWFTTGLVSRDIQGRFVLGSRLVELASAAGEDRLIASAGPVLMQLRDATGESAQIFRRQGDWRVCVASAERPIGLRDTIPVGTQLSMKAGSAAQVLLAWEDHDRLLEGLQAARFTPTVLAGVRRRGWGQSLGEREPGVASVSAPSAVRPDG